MKKLLLICILPFLFAFQCDKDDTVYSTQLSIQNNSSIDLVVETVPDNFIDIPSQSAQFLIKKTSAEGFKNPSEFEFLNDLVLYKRDKNENLVVVYEQLTIEDDLWTINESTTFEVEHFLVITDDLLTD